MGNPEVNDIMNHGITGWKYFSNPRIFEGYGRQKGWEREAPATDADNGREKTPDGFVEVTEQMELPSEKSGEMTAGCRPRCYPVAGPVAGKKPVTAGFSPL